MYGFTLLIWLLQNERVASACVCLHPLISIIVLWVQAECTMSCSVLYIYSNSPTLSPSRVLVIACIPHHQYEYEDQYATLHIVDRSNNSNTSPISHCYYFSQCRRRSSSKNLSWYFTRWRL
eukprot:c47765_g1_i1 orf=142-504(+)